MAGRIILLLKNCRMGMPISVLLTGFTNFVPQFFSISSADALYSIREKELRPELCWRLIPLRRQIMMLVSTYYLV